jgi:hypothetical protein
LCCVEKTNSESQSAKPYRELGRKIQFHHNTVKKYLTKINGHQCKARKSAPKTTAIRHQSYVDDPDAKLFHCKIVSDFVSRRSEKHFPEIPLALSISQIIDFPPVSFFHQIFCGYFFPGKLPPIILLWPFLSPTIVTKHLRKRFSF